MVGIPRSQGCKTCKRRKIKCDQEKPHCRQCRKSNRECEGYNQGTIFRNSSTRDFIDGVNSHDQSTTHSQEQSVNRITWVASHYTLQRKATASRANRSKQRKHPHAVANHNHAQSQLSQTLPLLHSPDSMIYAIQSITSQFLDLCLPLSQTQEPPLSWLREINSLHHNQYQNNSVDALPLAISALALSWAGRAADDNNHSKKNDSTKSKSQSQPQPELAEKGLQLYNAAIHQLRTDMSRNKYTFLEALVVTTVCVVFEMSHFGVSLSIVEERDIDSDKKKNNNTGWLTHMRGIAAFLQALGPEKVSDGPYVGIYSFCRAVFIMQGLHRRRRVCAGADMWVRIPFQNVAKSVSQRLYDLAAEVCEVLGLADELLQHVDTANNDDERVSPEDVPVVEAKQAELVLRRIFGLISRLELWMRESDIVALSGPMKYPRKSKNDDQATYQQSMMLCHSWALRLDLLMTILETPVLHSLLDRTDDFHLPTIIFAAGPQTTEQTPIALISSSCRILARNIALHFNIPSTAHSPSQNPGSLVAVYILSTAIRWYERQRGHANAASTVDTDVEMEMELEQHCRALLREIRATESRTKCPFDVSIFPDADSVLKCRWC
ncbi:hypothetical protein F4777DRAFT_582733 [Nemania sp. FL0916]|nr:hypothetical protein F4777DRAFT_582733 [Nemania sp. FL0916]